MGRMILLADDSPHTLRMGREYLAGLGYEVVTAEDAAAAEAVLRQQRPELILLDAALPGLSAPLGGPLGGMELCRRIKADAGLRSIPVLVLLGALAQLPPAEVAAADGVLRKPLSSAGLEGWLRQTAARAPDRSSGAELTPDEMLILAVQEAAQGR